MIFLNIHKMEDIFSSTPNRLVQFFFFLYMKKKY